MDYSKYSDIVKDKLSQYGNKLFIVRKIDEEYNPETNEYEGVEERIEGLGLLSNYTDENINGTTVKSGDVRVMAYFSTDKVVVGDTIEFGQKRYTVISIKELNPDGNGAIYYSLQGRE